MAHIPLPIALVPQRGTDSAAANKNGLDRNTTPTHSLSAGRVVLRGPDWLQEERVNIQTEYHFALHLPHALLPRQHTPPQVPINGKDGPSH